MKNRNRDAYLDDEEIEDGRTVRVPMMIMDGNRVNLTDTVRFDDGGPHFVRAADAASESSNFEDLDAGQAARLADLDAARDAVRVARDRWIAEMCDAWKRPPARDAAEPDAGERVLPHNDPAGAMRRHLFGPDDDAAPDPGDVRAVERQQRERDLAWNRYRENLANAWRTNPRAAPRIEREAESAKWRHGA
jgi:hypothetical protein